MRNIYRKVLMGGVHEIDVSLPLYKKTLRALLLASYGDIYRPSRARFMRLHLPPRTARNLLTSAVLVTVPAAVLINLVLFPPVAATNQAQMLAALAAQKVKHMSPAQIALVSQEYESLDKCLEEAIQSRTLRLESAQEVADLLPRNFKREHPFVGAYLTYANKQHHRVVIVLDAHSEPLYVADSEHKERNY